MRDLLLLLLALALVGAALWVVHTKVIAIEVGPHSSRLIGAVAAILAYYYWRHSFSLQMPGGDWSWSKAAMLARVFLPPLALFGAAVYYTVSILRNWRSEFVNLVRSSAWMVAVVGLVVAARYVLGL